MRVFLSHSSKDKDLVELVHEELGKKNAWYDAADIENGESIPEKISEGIRCATHYVLFWSYEAKKSNWVTAELNAAFIKMMANNCKFMIFTLDNTELPELLKPYKYDKIDKNNIEYAANIVVEKILSQEGTFTKLSEFIDRTKEIGDIEARVREGYKLIILNGILGIGKSTLAEKAINWLYSNRAMARIVIDFNIIPGIAELALELSNKTKKRLINNNKSEIEQKENIRYLMECISEANILLILKDVKPWLNEDGTMNKNLLFLTDMIVNTEMFLFPTLMTTSRYIEIPEDYYIKTTQLSIGGIDDGNISEIIKNNLPPSFSVENEKNLEFAKRLYGYPLGAKLGAYRIANHGYDYYLRQPDKIQKLKVSLAKQLISYAELSEECLEYLKIVALTQGRLRNEEYILVFTEYHDIIAKISEEAFFAGILKFSEEGCYKLELLVQDYFYELAFNDSKCKEYLIRLEKFLVEKTTKMDEDYMRIVPVTVHILTLNGKLREAMRVRSELTATMEKGVWDMYNHREYEEARKAAEQLIELDNENLEARYIKALCLIRFDDYENAKSILSELMEEDEDNEARYYYAFGRIAKKKTEYKKAIELFEIAILKRKRYLSPYRELAECYILMDNIEEAKKAIESAKKIDESNIFVILLEARLLQKEDLAEEAIKLLENQSIIEREPAQILFRKGRAYDQLEEKEKAKECYNKSLECDAKMYDAKLCLLNHQIIDQPDAAEQEINFLRSVLYGKRKCILSNIEARFVGYQKHEEKRAINILEGVPKIYRDRQWFAVKKQLLDNAIEKNRNLQRNILVKEYEKERENLDEIIRKKYGDTTLREVDLLPDA